MSSRDTITEKEFEKLCNNVYSDREAIYPLNPNVSHREALLWMLLGNLVSLLSVPILEQPSVYGGTSSDPYASAVIEIILRHASPAFDPAIHISKLSDKLDRD